MGRQRDIFPLPQMYGVDFKTAHWTVQRWSLLRKFANAVVGTLNWCYGVQHKQSTQATVAQADVLARIVDGCLDMHCRLQLAEDGAWETFVPDWIQMPACPSGPKYGNLQAEAVDVLEVAGRCDPLTCLDEHLRDVICSDKLMFSKAPSGMSSFEGISAEERHEYIKLVARQLCSKQLALADHAKGGGTVIAVSKPGGKRQRAVWHGKRVSAAAMRHPKPRHLASPTALSFMECLPGQKIRCSKRDASCWFDQLQLPASLQRWMGRPSVTARELCEEGGMTLEQVQSFVLPGDRADCESFFPVSLTWPMGFAWSSFVAQEFLQILSCDVQTPTSLDVAFAAATDDVMIFSTSGAGHFLKAAKQLDAVFDQIVRNKRKDVDDSLSATCVGVALEDGTHLAVPPARCLAMLFCLSYLLCRRKSSPKQVHQLLGVQQWYDLLCRCKLAAYDKVYECVRDEADTCVKTVPHLVLFELCAAMFLGFFWRQDLQRPFLPLLCATDASTEYGFGASVARLPVPMIRRLARIAEKLGAYVVMDGGFSPENAAKRLGQVHKLDISLDDFTDMFSIKSKHGAHINVLEGEAFVIWLRWILRSRKRHCTRVVVLVNSAVWLGAAAKGRSSTQLNRLFRKAAALELAGGIHVHLILGPSAENPSDRPSRGVRLKAPEVSTGQLQGALQLTAMIRGSVMCNLPALLSAPGMMCMGFIFTLSRVALRILVL